MLSRLHQSLFGGTKKANLRKQPTPQVIGLKAVVMDKSNYQNYETPMDQRPCPTLESVAAN